MSSASARQATVVELYEVLAQPLTPAGLLLGSGTNATLSAFQPPPLEARPGCPQNLSFSENPGSRAAPSIPQHPQHAGVGLHHVLGQ